jgi:hypothetical protein
MPEVVDLDALEASGGLVDLDADPEFANPAANDPFGYKRTGTALAKGAGETVANLGRLFQRGMAAGGIRTGDPIPESLADLEVPPEQEFAKGVGKFAATLPLTGGGGLGAQAARGAASGAMLTGSEFGAAAGAAGGAALHGASQLFSTAQRLAAALKDQRLRSAVLDVAEKIPAVGGQIERTRGMGEKLSKAKAAFKAAFEATRKTKSGASMAEATAAAATKTGGEKVAEVAAPSAKRTSEAAFKAKVAETRTAPTLDQVTPELVQRQGVEMAQKRINAALAKGDMQTARAVLEKINKEYGVKLNLRDLAKGKKP